MELSRRTLLALGVAVIAGACTDDTGSTPSTTATTRPPSTSTATVTDPTTTTGATTSTATSTSTTTVDTSTTVPVEEYDGERDPFRLGVASGDPDDTSVILWTRLAPDPLDGGGLDAAPYLVTWEVAADDDFDRIVASGTETADSDAAHSLHVLAEDLEPATRYWYRFRTGPHTSPVGRLRTLPRVGSVPARFVLGAASCQDYEEGFYAAHRDIAAAGLDALLWLGDYIYEGAGQPEGTPGKVRSHGTPEPTDLAGYRDRYALYKSDPDLQAAHASCAWFAIFDDHEVENNYAGLHSEDADVFGVTFRRRRDAAYRAWWEHMPVRLPPPVAGEEFRMYRQSLIGGLIELTMLDERQYRSDQSCGDVTFSLEPACAETFQTERTMLGAEQEQWFADVVGSRGAVWTTLANQVVLTDLTFSGAVLNYDQWDGYPFARSRLLQPIVDKAVQNVIVLTGDIHLAAVADVRAPGQGRQPVIAAEFVSTSISSSGNVDPTSGALLTFFPDIVGAELDHRGWTRHVVTPLSWSAELRTVNDVTNPDSPVSTFTTYQVRAGSPGVVRGG